VARIREIVRTSRSREEVFDHLADFTTSASWDPGIAAAKRLDAGPLGVGARFEVRLQLGPVTAPLVYEITTYDRPDRLVLTTVGRVHRGEDDVRFQTSAEGTEIVWNAMFAIRGPGRLIDPFLAVGFRKAGLEAVEGLAAELDGEVISRR
jgi:hypothetical protein